MDRRPILHQLFLDLLGSSNVYYQPPANVQMRYPAIVYNLNGVNTSHADNVPYRRRKGYLVTVIDRDPDSVIPDKVGQLPLTSFSRHFVVDGLNHDAFVVYF